MQEFVENIPLEKLKPFPGHPFQVRDDDAMRETAESIMNRYNKSTVDLPRKK